MKDPLFNQLLEILRVLSLDPQDQLSYLESIGLDEEIGELAMMFDDAYLLTPKFTRKGLINETQKLYLDRINQRLEKISGSENKYQWTRDGLEKSEEWSEIRSLALKGLAEILGDQQEGKNSGNHPQ